MEQDRQIVFGPFRLDLTTGRLWRGEREIGLRTRTRAVLGYLVTHPGRVIPREEFARHAWAGTHVSKTTLRVCVWEIRQALGDQATTPQYIETVGQQGYRFLAETGPGRPEIFSPVSHGTALTPPPAPFVGRQTELTRLQDCLAQVQRGMQQLVFVIGEAGAGKTTLVQRGELEHGVALITTGQGQYQRLGAQLMAPFFLAFLAEAYLRQGQVADGLQVINEALRLTATNFDRFWEAELYRLRGELLLAQEGARQSTPGPGAEDAEVCVQQALAIARQQGAKALELRAAMSLSRLWQRQGKRGKTRQLLVEVYGGFSEGFDTADLQAAQALLAELEG